MKHQAAASDVRRATGLIVLGYAYIVFVLIGSAWAGVALVRAWPWLVRAVTQFGLVYVVIMLEALWVRVPKPVGEKVTRAGSPRLIDEIERIARRLEAPVPNEVLINGEFNAAAAEIPRFGIFGAPRRYLIIGLPLLDALPADEIRAVIAHELAHLSRRHGRIRVLTARIATSWYALSTRMATQRRYVSWLFLPFFKWYVPKLQAAETQLSRGYEHESDELAAHATDSDAMARALVRMGVQRRRVSRLFIPRLSAESAQLATPPKDADSQMVEFYRAPVSAADIQSDVSATLEQRTTIDDDHPSLAERLEHLGLSADPTRLSEALSSTGRDCGAASAFLGEKRAYKLRAVTGLSVSSAFKEQWEALRELVTVWQDPDAGKKPGIESTIAFAKWTARTQLPADAIRTLREANIAAPNDEEVSMRLAALLLDEGGKPAAEEAIPILERVAAVESTAAFGACVLLRQALLRLDRQADARWIVSRENELRDARLATMKERSAVSVDDELVPAKLTHRATARLMAWLTGKPQVVRAFLLQKKTKHFQSTPMYVVALQHRAPWYKYEAGRAGIDLVRNCVEIVDAGPNADLRVLLVESSSTLLRRLRSIQGAAILDRLPHEKLRPVSQLPATSYRRKLRPAMRYLFVGFFVGAPILAHFIDPVDRPSGEDSSDAESQWVERVSPGAAQFGIRFVGLLRSGETDSVARLVSATAREPDSIAWAANLVRSVPHPKVAEVDRTMAFERHDGTVTRDYLGYAIVGDGDTVTVVIRTVEELGIRAVEFATTKRGRITDPDSVGQ